MVGGIRLAQQSGEPWHERPARHPASLSRFLGVVGGCLWSQWIRPELDIRRGHLLNCLALWQYLAVCGLRRAG
jgi:hypothetical protein